MIKDFRISHAIVISVALVVLGTLAYFDKESATVVMGVVTLLGAFGFVAYQQSEIKEHTAAIKQQTNGGYTQMLRIIEKKDQDHAAAIAAMAAKLAEMQPSASPPGQEHAS